MGESQEAANARARAQSQQHAFLSGDERNKAIKSVNDGILRNVVAASRQAGASSGLSRKMASDVAMAGAGQATLAGQQAHNQAFQNASLAGQQASDLGAWNQWGRQLTGGLIGAVSSAGQAASSAGKAALLSDKNAKTDIKKDNDIIDKLSKLRALTFRYKGSQDKKSGIIAQDLEKAGLGHMVESTPIGKVVDTGQLAATALAGVGELSKKILKKQERENG